MRAHLFLEGGGMVTGTHDVLAARRLIIDTYAWENLGCPTLTEAMTPYGSTLGEYEQGDLIYAMQSFASYKARCEVGRIVPAPPDNWDGYSWFWRSGYKLGKPGVTRAVVWYG